MRLYGGHEHEVLGEEAGERRNAGQREHQDGQHRRHDGFRRRQAGEVLDQLDIAFLLAPHGEDAGERAEGHDHVDQHVERYAADAGLGAGRQADERVAHVRDRGIGHQALDVRLADRREGAEHHGRDGDENDDLLPVDRDRLERLGHDANEHRHGRHLGRGREEGRHRRRRALVDVGRPHVERHGGDLEGDAGQHEDEAENQAERGAVRLERGGDLRKLDMSREAVDQRHAVEQHARRQSPEHEILQAGLRRADALAIDGGDDVERERLQFEAEIERDEAVGRNHEQHAERGQHQEDRKFELVHLFVAGVADRHHHGGDRADQDQDLHVLREIVGKKCPAIGRPLPADEDDPEAGHDQDRDGEPGDQGRRSVAGKHADHQEHHRPDGQDDFRHGELEACGEDVSSHFGVLFVTSRRAQPDAAPTAARRGSGSPACRPRPR